MLLTKEGYCPYGHKVNPRYDVEAPVYDGAQYACFPSSFTVIAVATTGLEPDVDEIIELSAIKVVEDEVVGTFNSLVCPTITIPAEATDYNGITNDMVKNAPRIGDIFGNYLAFLGDDVLIGQKAVFHLEFILVNCAGLYLKEFSNDYIDTIFLAQTLLPNLSSYRLDSLTKYFDVQFDYRRRASSNTRAILAVFHALKDKAIRQHGSVDSFMKAHNFADPLQQRTRTQSPSKSAKTTSPDTTAWIVVAIVALVFFTLYILARI